MNANNIISIQDVTVGAITEPITVQDVKDYLRIEGFTAVGGTEVAFNDDDIIIGIIITAAREQFEKYSGITLTANRSKKVVLNNFYGALELPFGPVKEVTALINSNGDDLLSSVETVGTMWVCLTSPTGENIAVTYTCGYGTTGIESLPASIKLDLLRACAYFYTNRGDAADVNNFISQLAKKYSRVVICFQILL